MVKVNMDAACKPSYGTGIGCVIRDERGIVLWMMAEVLHTAGSVEEAEAMVVSCGVLKALEKGYVDVVVEVDSQVVFWALQKSKEDISYFGGIVKDIRNNCSF